MLFRSNLRACATAGFLSLALGAAATVWAPAARGGAAGVSNVTLENFNATSKDGSKIFIKRADFIGANLTQDEIAKLLSPETPDKEEIELVKRLSADKISIPSIEVTPKEGGKITLHDFSADDVAAGKVGKIMIAGIDGAGTEDGAAVAIRSGALRLEGADLAGVLKATGAAGEAARGHIGHLVWESVDIVAPDKESGPGKTIHIALGSFELSSDYDGDTLKKGATVLKGLIIEPAPGSEFATGLAALGYPRLEIAAAIGARYQANDKTLSLDDLTIEGVQMGLVGVKASFGDVDPALISSGDRSQRMQALMGCSIAALEVKIVNAGLFEKALAYYAKQQGTTPDALRQQVSAAAVQLTPLILGGDPSSLKLATEAKKFIDQPNNLTVSIKAKGAPLKAADFMAGDPSDIVGKVDISATANQ
jgi:hypothetical protein